MSILKKLFGGKKSGKSRPDGKCISYLQMVLKDFEVNSHTCEICGATFALPTGNLKLFTSTIDGWYLDVGGVCLNQGCANAYRFVCSKHIKFVQDTDGFWSPGCQSCDHQLHPGSPEVFQYIDTVDPVKTFNSLRTILVKKQK